VQNLDLIPVAVAEDKQAGREGVEIEPFLH